MSDERRPVDGRRARRDRNREAVVAATMEIMRSGDGFFGLQQVADRSGVSLRSVHRYFDDSEDVALVAIEAFVERHRNDVAFTPPPPDAPLAERIDAWVDFRVAGHQMAGYPAIAALARGNRSPKVAATMEALRWRLVRGVEVCFGPELDALEPDERRAALAMAHSVTLIEAWDNLRTRHGLDPDQIGLAWRAQLHAVFGPASALTMNVGQ